MQHLLIKIQKYKDTINSCKKLGLLIEIIHFLELFSFLEVVIELRVKFWYQKIVKSILYTKLLYRNKEKRELLVFNYSLFNKLLSIREVNKIEINVCIYINKRVEVSIS